MKLGIMQPYFFPYLGYFSLIKHTDRFILFDTPQFIYHGWIERNRVLKQTGGWQYISVPLQKHTREEAIRDIRIDGVQPWKEKLKAQLVHYKKAPCYWPVMKMLNTALEEEFEDITHQNKFCLEQVCRYLNISADLDIFSEMGLSIGSVQAPDEWALRICQAIPGANAYWNPPGGVEFFDRQKYEKAGIDLKFQKMVLDEYPQKGAPFEPGLSILDVMMFNSPEKINEMLDHYEIL